MTEYCAIVPDRGDRPAFTQLCLERLSAHNWIAPIHVDYAPFLKNGFDLVDRIKIGVEAARETGFKKAFIVENDDWYSPDYFKPFDEDFIGYDDTIYYHIKNKTWEKTFHSKHASLFSTAFKISVLDNFKWPKPSTVFLDIELWKHAMRFNYKLNDDNPNIGIKHGIGLCGGMGHRQVFPNHDPQMKWLESKVDSESLELYKRLNATSMESLIEQPQPR